MNLRKAINTTRCVSTESIGNILTAIVRFFGDDDRVSGLEKHLLHIAHDLNRWMAASIK